MRRSRKDWTDEELAESGRLDLAFENQRERVNEAFSIWDAERKKLADIDWKRLDIGLVARPSLTGEFRWTDFFTAGAVGHHE